MKHAHLASIRIQGFRSCLQTIFRPNAGLSVLIGRNGSGKTNVLQALRLLGLDQLRGMRRRAQKAPADCRLTVEFRLPRVVTLQSFLGYSLDAENREQVITSRERWKLGPVRASSEWFEPGRQGASPYPYHVSLSEMIERLGPKNVIKRFEAFEAVSPKLRPELPRLLAWVQKADRLRSNVTYYSASQFTNPARCPTSLEVDEESTAIRPEAFSAHQRFLLDVYRLRETNPALYASYTRLVNRHGLGLVDEIYWKRVKVASSQIEVKTGGKIERKRRQRLLIVPSAKVGHDRLSFNQLSEGTFRTLALIFYLMTDQSELLLVEEPEVCVHQGLLSSIIELVKTQSAHRQIIISTHSDFVLDQVAVQEVFVVGRSEGAGTIVRGLATHYPADTLAAIRAHLRSEGNLGEFWRQGGLDS